MSAAVCRDCGEVHATGADALRCDHLHARHRFPVRGCPECYRPDEGSHTYTGRQVAEIVERACNHRAEATERVWAAALRVAAIALVEVHGKGGEYGNALLTAMVREVEREI